MRRTCLAACHGLTLLLLATPALAHAPAPMAGLVEAFWHVLWSPLHIVPFIAIGLWAVLLGRPAIWVMPITVPVALVLGAAAVLVLPPLGWLPLALALGCVSAGLLVALAVEPPLVLAAALSAVYAAAFGHLHMTDTARASLEFTAGIGAIALLGSGIGVAAGLLLAFFLNNIAVRLVGFAAACFGVYAVAQIMG